MFLFLLFWLSTPLESLCKMKLTTKKHTKWGNNNDNYNNNNNNIIIIIIIMNEWMNEWMNEESWMRGQQTCPLTIHFNMWTASSDVSIQRLHWQPLSVHLWACCSHPAHDVNDAMNEGWPQHRGLRPLLFFEQWCGFFYVAQEPDKCKCCETGPTVFRPYPRRLESLTVCRCHYKGSTFFSVI